MNKTRTPSASLLAALVALTPVGTRPRRVRRISGVSWKRPYQFAAIALAVALASPSLAGIKYWDNPAFKAYDVGDYVQDGLVLNYDGIRNAGATAAHDPNATTWVNLGTGGATYDMVRKGAPTSSCWTDTGFFF